jgi:hypothetical protein
MNGSARGRCGFDQECAGEKLDPLRHPYETEATSRGRWLEAATVVAHLHLTLPSASLTTTEDDSACACLGTFVSASCTSR